MGANLKARIVFKFGKRALKVRIMFKFRKRALSQGTGSHAYEAKAGMTGDGAK